jgi:hypothetical protein
LSHEEVYIIVEVFTRYFKAAEEEVLIDIVKGLSKLSASGDR